jgi:hypothetical protein
MILRNLILILVLSTFPIAGNTRDEAPENQTFSSEQGSQLVEHGSYTNSKGSLVHSPAHTKNGQAPVGASAKCRDGSYSFSQSRRGTCSHHGGVEAWMN